MAGPALLAATCSGPKLRMISQQPAMALWHDLRHSWGMQRLSRGRFSLACFLGSAASSRGATNVTVCAGDRRRRARGGPPRGGGGDRGGGRPGGARSLRAAVRRSPLTHRETAAACRICALHMAAHRAAPVVHPVSRFRSTQASSVMGESPSCQEPRRKLQVLDPCASVAQAPNSADRRTAAEEARRSGRLRGRRVFLQQRGRRPGKRPRCERRGR